MRGFSRWIIFCLAGLAFFAPLKFGTPVISEPALIPPNSVEGWIYFTWPQQIATIFAFGALLWLVLDGERLAARMDLLFVLPLIFLGTQIIATPASIAPQTSMDTLLSFAVNVLLFYAAAWYVRDGATAARIFGALGIATMLVMVFALEQYFGGLQKTREFAALQHLPPEFIARLESNRVFGSLVYPNALAGFLVLAFAPTLAWIWARSRSWIVWMKWATLVFAGGLMLFCLALTGSRGGFVAFAAMIAAGLSCFALKRSRRIGWILAALLAVAAFFVLAHRTGLITLKTGSVVARSDYWRGAVAIALDHPWLGTGPGTFGSIYPKYKNNATEETQLVHNNFLQMASDSGMIAFLVFALLWLVALRDAFQLARQRPGDAAAIAICAAVAGWIVHSLLDFDLYVPGVAMPAFLLMGILQGLKETPATEPAPLPHRHRVAMGIVCALAVACIVRVEGRSFRAALAHGRALELKQYAPGRALIEIREAIALAPRTALYHSLAGDLSLALDQVTEATEHYRAATESDPYRASYHWRLARALDSRGQSTAALEQFQRAQELNPGNTRYLQDLAAAKESVRQPDPHLLESVPATQRELDSSAATR